MPGKLLISRENGSTVKTYGLNTSEKYNMKFAFLCVVIIISCSVCASGDLEIYPGEKFDLSLEEQRRANLEDSDDGSFYPERFPIEDDYDEDERKKEIEFALSERIQNLQDLIEKNRYKTNVPIPYYFDPTTRRYIEENYQNLEDKERYNNFRTFSDHGRPILDDVRPYPHEDDFTFGEDEGEEDGGELLDEKHHHHHHDDEEKNFRSTDDATHEESSGKGAVLENAQFVQDPTQFAYPPSDVRFFQTKENQATQPEKSKIEPQFQKLEEDNNKFHVKQRSGDRFLNDDETMSKNGDEKSGGNFVEVVAVRPHLAKSESAGVYIIAIVAGISAAATVGLIAAAIGWYSLQKHVKSASDVEYPAYGVTGPNKDTSPSGGDRRLAQSAQMYHYQHQKQQIIAMESRAAAGDRHGSVSEADSDEENEEGDYTVYECPGLAPTGEMEVKNPLFQDDPTPAQTPPVNSNGDDEQK